MNDIIIMDVVEDTVVDGPGFRSSIYAAGCPHRCDGCHNPSSWNISNGTRVDIPSLMVRIRKNECADVTFSGGEPFGQAEKFTELAACIKKETGKNIWCYTGYKFEELVKDEIKRKLLEKIDVLVDGKYDKKMKSDRLRFRGSLNQRIIDVPKSLEIGSTVIIEY
ncbi:MAG: anaerobic ribonucleoside-triphosphate reductase activating protein [Rikenellaceae bacterium]|nr:anaerobic ribonucleoside-triphosphate reductase activating protein [Rikenellaceae bacterium]